MALMDQMRVTWEGLSGLPGVSTFYTEAGNEEAGVAAIQDFFDAVKALHPDGLVWTIENTGVIIDSATGETTGTWSSVGAAQTVDATGAASYSAPSGWLAKWKTGVYVGGRQVIGKTFMVPLSSTFYDSQGNIDAEALIVMRDAVDDFAAAELFEIYSPTHQVREPIASGVVPDKAVILRSRRD